MIGIGPCERVCVSASTISTSCCTTGVRGLSGNCISDSTSQYLDPLAEFDEISVRLSQKFFFHIKQSTQLRPTTSADRWENCCCCVKNSGRDSVSRVSAHRERPSCCHRMAAEYVFPPSSLFQDVACLVHALTMECLFPLQETDIVCMPAASLCRDPADVCSFNPDKHQCLIFNVLYIFNVRQRS